MKACQRCDGNCCRHYLVPITGNDIRDIKSLGYSAEEFVDFTPIGSMECGYPDVRLHHGYCYMVLKKSHDSLCVFAQKEGKQVKCKIHGCHPLLCRIYPYDPINNKIREIHVCPTVDKPQKDLMPLVIREENALKEYITKVMEWNNKPLTSRGRGEFLRFIVDTD